MFVVGGRQGNDSYKILLLQQIQFFVSVEFYGDHNIEIHNFEVNLAILNFWDISRFMAVGYVSLNIASLND